MKKIFIIIHLIIFLFLMPNQSVFAMEGEEQQSLEERLRSLGLIHLYVPQEVATKQISPKFLSLFEGEPGFEMMFAKFQKMLTGLGRCVQVFEMGNLKEFGDVGLADADFAALEGHLKVFFDRDFFRLLLEKNCLVLTRREDEGCYGLRWIIQSSFMHIEKYCVDFETAFLAQVLIPCLVPFFNEWFIIKKLNLANNDLTDIPSCILVFQDLEYLNIQGNYLRALPFLAFSFQFLRCLFFSVDSNFTSEAIGAFTGKLIREGRCVVKRFE